MVLRDIPKLMDEATSGFDVESDAYLHDVILHQMQGKTVIMITHHYHNLEGMDQVWRLEREKYFLWKDPCIPQHKTPGKREEPMSNPNVHLFRTSQMPYLYDVNTDTILPISEQQFHEAKAEQKSIFPLVSSNARSRFPKGKPRGRGRTPCHPIFRFLFRS